MTLKDFHVIKIKLIKQINAGGAGSRRYFQDLGNVKLGFQMSGKSQTIEDIYDFEFSLVVKSGTVGKQ